MTPITIYAKATIVAIGGVLAVIAVMGAVGGGVGYLLFMGMLWLVRHLPPLPELPQAWFAGLFFGALGLVILVCAVQIVRRDFMDKDGRLKMPGRH